eukprot:17420-Heterococcus_DN1.PRE.1
MLQLVTKRWRTKVVYIATAVLISMVYKRVSRALRLRRLRSGDVYVDADDHEYVNRGTVYEVQMAAVLQQYKQSSEMLSSQAQTKLNSTALTLLQKLDTTVKGAMSVRSSYKRRARYAVELSNSIRQLHDVSEQLREKEALSQQDEDDHLQQHLTVVDSVIILNTVRLADVQLRIVRDTLLATTHEFHALMAFWNEKKQQDKRMNFIKSVALKAIHRHKGVSGKALTIMADQERIVSLELLSKRYLLRLGTIEKLLLDRPKIAIPLHDDTPLITAAVRNEMASWSNQALHIIADSLAEEEQNHTIATTTTTYDTAISNNVNRSSGSNNNSTTQTTLQLSDNTTTAVAHSALQQYYHSNSTSNADIARPHRSNSNNNNSIANSVISNDNRKRPSPSLFRRNRNKTRPQSTVSLNGTSTSTSTDVDIAPPQRVNVDIAVNVDNDTAEHIDIHV